MENKIEILTRAANNLKEQLCIIALDTEPNKNLCEKALGEAESIVLQMRAFYESISPEAYMKFKKPQAPRLENITGIIEVTRYNWLHIQLNTLLPHCRYAVPAYLSDTLAQLLKGFASGGGKLPKYEKAFLVIEEHCNIKSRRVFDEDNKGWKAIPNALKGAVIKDDDQFSLQIALLSKISDTACCHIYVMDKDDAEVFFSIRNEHLNRSLY